MRTIRPVVVLLATCALAVGQATADLNLMPWPAHIALGTGQFKLTPQFTAKISGAGAQDARVRSATVRALQRLARQSGVAISPRLIESASQASLRIIVERKSELGPQKLGEDEAYHLTVTADTITLTAGPLGVLRGLETLLQMATRNPFPILNIADQPRFPWRGLSLDVSRHFIPLDAVKRTIDGLAMVKMNVFHWHLSDDQGFRVESKRYPRLHQLGSHGLYYTQAQVREVIAYARDRGVRVVPEFDIPAHATSWFVGYPWLATGRGPHHVEQEFGVLPSVMDPTKESTFVFLDSFIGEMSKLFPDAYFHIGGDEVPKNGEWTKSAHIAAFMKTNQLPDHAALQAYFNRRVLQIVTKYGKHMEGWDEILHPDLPKNSVIQSWRGQQSLAEAARQGYSGILSNGYYLDLMQPAAQHYAVDPIKINAANEDPSAAPLTAEEQQRIIGGEAAMWEELATQENIDVKLWPRTAAIAERLWSPADITDSASMYRRLVPISKWLDMQGLRHLVQLRHMRVRLAGSDDGADALARFAIVLEPMKNYTRHRNKKYFTTTPLNRLVDALAPESDAAREFRDSVSQFTVAGDPGLLREQLRAWRQTAADVIPILSNHALLQENVEVAHALGDICTMGLEALNATPRLSKQRAQVLLDSLEEAAKPKAEIVIALAPAIRALIEKSIQ